MLSRIPGCTTGHPVTLAVAKLIQSRCEHTILKFKD